jgi:hypothetical protein
MCKTSCFISYLEEVSIGICEFENPRFVESFSRIVKDPDKALGHAEVANPRLFCPATSESSEVIYASLDSSPVAQRDENECMKALAPIIPANFLLFYIYEIN